MKSRGQGGRAPPCPPVGWQLGTPDPRLHVRGVREEHDDVQVAVGDGAGAVDAVHRGHGRAYAKGGRRHTAHITQHQHTLHNEPSRTVHYNYIP